MTRFGVAMAALMLMGAAPDITGLWLTQDGAGVVSIEPCDGASVCGTFVGFRNQPPPRDYQGASECGLQFIHPAQLGDDGRWHGEITDPTQGSDYRADLALTPDGKLNLRGYLGISLFGQTQVWTRYSGETRPDCSIG